jgi:hypothetical protein
MNDSIISRDTIRARARVAFERGAGRDSHGMNPGAPALRDWLDEYDHCYAQWARGGRRTVDSQLAGVSPP